MPKFDYNEDFNLSVFEENFDFMIARSIWTHCAKWQIQKMLNEFCKNSHKDSLFLTSILRTNEKEGRIDYTGDSWIGKSHTNNKKGTISHSIKWINNECLKRGLLLAEPKLYEHGKQHWLLISHKE